MDIKYEVINGPRLQGVEVYAITGENGWNRQQIASFFSVGEDVVRMKPFINIPDGIYHHISIEQAIELFQEEHTASLVDKTDEKSE